jgi:glycosyltransferase involved in cell wall biosynthesis
MEKVSIIIPTLNRSHLLEFALKSALLQDYGNLEILVCDDFSDDNTKNIVDSFGDKRVVYFKTEKRLNMPDSFEFALSKASGDYITFLTDACYLLPGAVSEAMRAVNEFKTKIAMWGNCVYCYPDWMEKVRGNTLQISRFTFKDYLIDSRKALEKLYDNIRDPVVPKSINSLCHKSVVEKAIKIQGRFFIPSTPDHTSAVSMLENSENFVFIDKPLFIGSLSSSNIGASQSFNLGEKAKNFLKSFEGKKIEEITFLGIYVTSALIIKGLENVREFYKDNCPEINIRNAIFEIIDNLVKLEIYGTNVDDYWKIFNNYISSGHEYLKFATIKKKMKSRLKWAGVKFIRSSPVLYRIEPFIRNSKILKGDKYNFNNIQECAGIVEKINNLK